MFVKNPLPMWIYERATLRFIDVNHAAIEQYGFTREEFLQRTIADIRPPEDVAAIVRSVAEGRHGWRRAGVWRHRRKDGGIFYVDITAHDCALQGLDCVMVAALDVTELRSANERLERSERRYRELIESINDVVLTTDLEGRFTYVSPNAARYGYSPETLLGRTFHQLIHPEDLPRVLEATEATLSGQPVQREYRAFDAWGGVHHLRTSFSAMFDDDGQPIGLSGIMGDITEQRKAEEQLHVSQRLEAVGRLAGGIAHDFNNLLVVINGYTELGLTRLPPDDPLRADLQEIQLAGQRAAALTQQLLAFGRKQLLRPASVDLNDVVRRMTAMLTRVIGEDVIFETDLAPHLPATFIDVAQLENAILNLVLNARDAMPNGGRLRITTSVRARHDDLPVRPDRPIVVLTISDTGSGMDDLTRERVFEPFFTTKPQGQGSGLGLPMVYGFVKQSGGALDLSSEPGRGTRVSIALAADAPDRAATPAGSPPRVQGGEERILVVEDDDAVRALVGRVLTSAGYRWLAAASPREALDLLHRHDGDIDVLLTDFVMPEMTGAELAERVLQAHPGIRVVYMTGYRDISRGGTNVADGAPTLSKPFTAAQLTAAIRAALEST